MDTREFIAALSEARILTRVEREVDWRFELGEITRKKQSPLLFENVKDYPGQRVFTNGMISVPAMGVALGMGPVKRSRTLVDNVKRKAGHPIEPRIVNTGPVAENVVPASAIDFTKLPVPQWSEQDSGRYLGTWHINVTCDPETGTRNLGVYRMEILGPNQATISTSLKSHLGQHLAKAEMAGRPLEMAVAIGTSEAVVLAAASGYPFGKDEYELAGALQAQAVDVIKCSSVNLEVPADSEIAIEGIIKPGVRVKDGPYFDYAGAPTTNPQAFLFEATRLMFRNNPIFRGAAIGQPGAEDQQILSLLSALDLFNFHDSRLRHALQTQLLKRRFFRAFQFAGRIKLGTWMDRIGRIKNTNLF